MLHCLSFFAAKLDLTQQRSITAEMAVRSWRLFAKSVTTALPQNLKPPREIEDEKKGLEFFAQPQRPTGMCEAQRVDFNAACERRITWHQYFEKWGRQGLSL